MTVGLLLQNRMGFLAPVGSGGPQNKTIYLNPAISTAVTPDAPDLNLDRNIRFTALLRDDSIESTTSRHFIYKLATSQYAYATLASYSTSFYGLLSFADAAGTGQLGSALLRTAMGTTPPGTDVGVGSLITNVGGGGNASVQPVKSNDGGLTWTPVGAPIVNTPQANLGRDTTAPLVIGNQCQGRIFWVQAENVDASGNPTGLIWRFDAAEYPGGGVTTWTDPRGRQWSISNASAIVNPLLDAVLAETFENLNNWTHTGGTPTLVSGRTGNCMNNTGTLISSTYTIPPPSESDTIILGFAWQAPAIVAAGHLIAILRSDAATTQHTYLRTDSTGALQVYNGAGAQLPGGSYAANFQPNTWYYIEYRSYLHDTAGTAEVWIDGVKILNLSALDTKNGGTKTVYDSVRLMRANGSTPGTNLWDDLYIKTGAAAVPTGPIKVY